MNRLFKNVLIALLAVTFYATSFVVPWVPGQNGAVSVAEAQQTKKQQRQERKRLRKQQRQEKKKAAAAEKTGEAQKEKL